MREFLILAVGALFGLGATMTAMVGPAYLSLPLWSQHWLFWAGIALMALMGLDAIALFFARPSIVTALCANVCVFFFAATLISYFTPSVTDFKLGLSGVFIDAEYPNGTVLSGINWRPEFTELKIHINNPSSRPYTTLSLLFVPSVPVAAINQATNVPHCFFQTNRMFSANQIAMNLGSGARVANPLVLIGTNDGYRLNCETLPAKTTLTVMMALANIKWKPPQKPSQPTPSLEQVMEKDYVLRAEFEPGIFYWLGHADGKVYSLPRPAPEWVKVDGQYAVEGSVFTVSQQIPLIGKLDIITGGR
jgi:hypothetical protein